WQAGEDVVSAQRSSVLRMIHVNLRLLSGADAPAPGGRPPAHSAVAGAAPSPSADGPRHDRLVDPKSSRPHAATAPFRSRPGQHLVTAADLLPDDLPQALD